MLFRSGNGSAPHFASEMFNTAAGIKLTHVPYKDSTPAVIDLIGGQVQVMFTGIPSVLAYIKSNRVRVLAVTGKTRTAALPDAPTVIEAGVPGYEVSPWFGVLVPARTPRERIEIANRAINTVLQKADVRRLLAAQGAAAAPGTSAEFAQRMRADIDKWTRVIRAAGIQSD